MKILYSSILTTLISLSGMAQVSLSVYQTAGNLLNDKEIRQLGSAREKFDNGFYRSAILSLDSITLKEQPIIDYIKGVFYAYDEGFKNKSLAQFAKAEKEAEQLEGFYLNKAFSYFRLDSFATAIQNYNKALEKEQAKKSKNKKLLDEIHLRIEQCRNIMAMKNKKNTVAVKNIGHPINSDFSEYCPIITSNENMMVFTYRGPKSLGGKQKLESGLLHKNKIELYYEDIFVSRKLNDTLWSEPEQIKSLDTRSHDAAVSINSDGTEMFIYKNLGAGKGDLYLTRLKGKNWTKPVKQLHLNSSEWEGSACFITNDKRIIFASERKGGYGGKDLYYAERVGEDTWGNIKNLGPVINSKYDEDAPFVTTDGKILFFSTNNELSIGGYDIERSDLVNGFWSKPYNLGPPINTTYDDLYFTVRADGRAAYYSSSQKNGSGGQDIYVVKPGIPGKPAAMLQVEGLVTVDGKPVEAEIELRSMIKDLSMDITIKSNEVDGKFLCNLSSRDEYELTIHTNGFPPQVISLNTNEIDSFVVMNVFAEFHKAEFGEDDEKYHISAYNTHRTIEIEQLMLKRHGDLKLDDVSYRVQIGAYKFPKHFDYNHFIGLPKIVMQKDSLNITHFTVGDYHTYAEAHALLEKVKESVKTAFVVVYDRGRRVKLKDHFEMLSK